MPQTTLFGDPVSTPDQVVEQPQAKITMFGDPIADQASTQRTAFGDPILAPSMEAMTPQQIEEFQKQGYETEVKRVQSRFGVPDFVARALLSGGKPVDVAIGVGLPLAGQIVGGIGGAVGGTAAIPVPVAGTAAGAITGMQAGGALGGAAATGLVQMREMARGERQEFGVGQAIADIGLGAFVPKPLAAAAEGASLASRLGQIAIQRGKEGAMLGAASETVKQVVDPATAQQEAMVRTLMEKYGQDESTARMVAAGGEIATAGTLGSLVGAGLGASLEGLAPAIWKKVFNRTPEQAATILAQETQTPEVVNARKVLDDILGPVETRTPTGEQVQQNIDVMMGVPPPVTQAPSEGAQMVASVERELGLTGPEAAAKPFMRKAADAAEVLNEAMAAQDRKIANLAGRLDEDLVQNRLGMEEISPMTEMDRIRALDRRAMELAERPGESAREQARIAAERERLVGQLPEEAPMAMAEDIPPTAELSAQASRMMDEYGRVIPKAAQSLGLGGVGFVYGWNTGEDLPPEDRLVRAIEFGAGGLFAPVAIRKIISLQGWANSVLKERGPGSGALNTADPEVIGALAVKGATLLDEGANTFSEWSKRMVSRFGNDIRPKLKEIWSAGEKAEIIPIGAVMDAPAPKVVGDRLPSNTAGVLLYSDYPKSAVKRTNSEVAELVQDAAIRANNGRITSANITPTQETSIVDRGVEEVLAGLKKSNHAGEWYTTQVDDGNTILGTMFPVLRDDAAAQATGKFNSARDARVAAAVAQAATSQNLTVKENGKYTVEQFEKLLKNGRFDTVLAKEYGTKAKSIAGNLELANSMADAVGWSGVDDFIRKDFTIRELQDAVKKVTGKKVSIAGKMDDVVQGAAIFGPKIGQGFLQNLLGRFDPVTIDLWMRRTWGRWTGDVLAEGILPEQLGRYIKSVRDEGIELPASLRGVRITPKGKSKLMIPESMEEKLATDADWKKEIYDHALKVFNRWDKEVYPYLKGNITPKQKQDVLSGKITVGELADEIRKSDARIEAAWTASPATPVRDIPSVEMIRGKAKGSKASFAEQLEASMGRTENLSNDEISALKPEWAKSSTVIVNVFEPIDIPSGKDREVITRVVNGIREKLADRGIRMTNADIQATLWYPEKDIWAKLAGESESGLKQSYDTVFLKLAEDRGLGKQASDAVTAARAARSGRAAVTGTTQAAGEGAAVAEASAAQPALTSGRQVRTDTPEFKSWFRRSTAIDEAGKPKGYYHGTPTFEGTGFKPTESINRRGNVAGYYFTPNAEEAGYYAGEKEGAQIIKAYLSVQNPFVPRKSQVTPAMVESYRTELAKANPHIREGDSWFEEKINKLIREKRVSSDALNGDGDAYQRVLKAGGYDGFQDGEHIAVFSPTQIKSVFNRGSWSPATNDISGFINQSLGLRAGSAAAGFAYGFADGKDLPPEKRLTNALIYAGATGAIAPALLGRMIRTANNVGKPASPAVTGGPATPKTLADVEKIFTAKPEGAQPTFAEKMQSVWAKGVTKAQNVYKPLDVLEESVLGKAPKITLGDRFSLVAGAAGKAEAGTFETAQAQKQLIPDITNKDLNNFLFLRRTFDRLNTMAKDPTAGSRAVGNWTMPDVQTVMGELHNRLGTDKLQRLEQFAQVLQKSADDDLQLMVRSGRMSPTEYLDIKSKNDFYAPFYVMDYFAQHEGAAPGMGRSIDTTQPLSKAIKGIEDEDFRLGDLLTAFKANKLRANILAEKNAAMQELAKLTQADPNGHLIKDLGPAAAGIKAPKDWSTVNYMENGVQKRLAVSREVANAVKGMDTQQLGLLATVASIPASTLRAGATGLNASFQVVNQFKDAARFGFMSKYGFRSVADVYQFPLDLASGFVTSWKSNVFSRPDSLYFDYLNSGAARSTLASQLSPDSFTKLAQQADQSAAAKIIGAPLKFFLDSTSKIGNAIEETVKVAGFKRGARMENLANLKGRDYDEALQRLAYEVRNYAGSPDFSKHGSVGKELNLLFMFANARIQGLAADLRRLSGGTGKREGMEALLAVTGGVGFITYYLWNLNQQPENIADFKSRPLTERNNYFLIPRYNKAGQPAYFINEQGEKVREFWRFPKSEIVGQVANTIEGALDYAKTKDPKAAMAAGVNLLENMSPISITGRNMTERLESVASGLNPVIKAPLELATNRSFFAHRDIVPRSLQEASPLEQYRRTTPPAFRQMAAAMPESMPDRLRSPLHLQQLTSNLTAGLFTQFMRPEQEGRDPLVANPVLGRFFSAPYLDKEEDWRAIEKFKTPSVDANLNRQRAIDDFLKKADGMPAQQKFDQLRQILSVDPERNTQALLNAMRDKMTGTTDLDRYVRAMDAKSRAQYLEWKASTLPSQQERTLYYNTMAQRGVLTKDVGEEIVKLRQAAGQMK